MNNLHLLKLEIFWINDTFRISETDWSPQYPRKIPSSGVSSYPGISRSMNGSGSTKPSVTNHLSSGLLRRSANEPGETQQLAI